MDLKDICVAKWGSLAAAERAIDIGGGMLNSISDKGSTTTRSLRKILDAIEPTDAQRRAILTQFGLVPAVVNAGLTGTGDLAWPGPWQEVGYGYGIWERLWGKDLSHMAAYSDGQIRNLQGHIIRDTCHDLDSATKARAADAILATICAGKDPHPYPAELLATDGGKG